MSTVLSLRHSLHPLLLLATASLLLGLLPRPRASAAEAGTLQFVVIGDWGRNGKYLQRETGVQMGRTAEAIGARFVISTGDNFYPDGVAGVDDPQWKTSFEDIYTAASLQCPWYVVLGNHDYHKKAQAQVDYSAVSRRWRMPARYFAFSEAVADGVRADFFLIDSNALVEGYRKTEKYGDLRAQDEKAQLAWLEKALAASTARWRIVVSHHPVYSSSGKHGDTKELVRDIKPLLEKHGVQVFLNGHEHDMQHLKEGRVHYFCSGAGSQTRDTSTGPRTQFSLGKRSGFMTVALTADTFTGRFIDNEGVEVYKVALPASP